MLLRTNEAPVTVNGVTYTPCWQPGKWARGYAKDLGTAHSLSYLRMLGKLIAQDTELDRRERDWLRQHYAAACRRFGLTPVRAS